MKAEFNCVTYRCGKCYASRKKAIEPGEELPKSTKCMFKECTGRMYLEGIPRPHNQYKRHRR